MTPRVRALYPNVVCTKSMNSNISNPASLNIQKKFTHNYVFEGSRWLNSWKRIPVNAPIRLERERTNSNRDSHSSFSNTRRRPQMDEAFSLPSRQGIQSKTSRKGHAQLILCYYLRTSLRKLPVLR